MKSTNMFIIGLAVLFCWSGSLYADYTLHLKNGRYITVKEYREEDGTIKIYVPGGEISIAKVQIKSIARVVGEGEWQGIILPDAEPSPTEAVETRQEEEKMATPGPLGEGEVEEKKEEPVGIKKKAKTSEELLKERRAKEEKEYQEKVREITGRIKVLRDRYSLATKGRFRPKPSLLDTEEAIRSRTANLRSRLREEQINTKVPSSDKWSATIFKTRKQSRKVARLTLKVSPPNRAKEKKLSMLRAQMTQLHNERERLIEEMKRKNFNTGSLFLE